MTTNYNNEKMGIAPFAHDIWSTDKIMFCMVIALLPSAGYGIFSYGGHAALLLLVSVAVSVLTEVIYRLVLKQEQTIWDYSAVVTGLCFGMILPPSAPVLFAILGAVIATLCGKLLWGGIGCNYVNPAGLGKLVLVILFHSTMVNYAGGGYGGISPLTELAMGNTVSLSSMLLGNVPSNIGTGNAITILIGAIFLFLVGVIDIEIPLVYIGVFSIYTLLFGRHGLSGYYLGQQLAGGGLLFTAFFMANDYATRPATRRARLIYGAAMGLLTGLLRTFGATDNGTLFALLLVNLSSRLLDTALLPRAFGTRQVRRTIKVRPTAREEDLMGGKTEAEIESEQLDADFQEFENRILPRGAAGGSETAGTIGKDAVSRYENRSPIQMDFGQADFTANQPPVNGPQAGPAEGPVDAAFGFTEDVAIQAPAEEEASREFTDPGSVAPAGSYYPQQTMAAPMQNRMDPATGLPIDPVTGLLMDPNTGYLLDPATGLPIDPVTGLLIDPKTGCLIDPGTGRLIDPQTLQLTGQVYVPAPFIPNAAASAPGAAPATVGAQVGPEIPTMMGRPEDLAGDAAYAEEADAEPTPKRPKRMSPGQMERHLKRRQRELMREAINSGEPETIMDDTTRLDVEAIVRAEQELLEKGENEQYESLEFVDLGMDGEMHEEVASGDDFEEDGFTSADKDTTDDQSQEG